MTRCVVQLVAYDATLYSCKNTFKGSLDTQTRLSEGHVTSTSLQNMRRTPPVVLHAIHLSFIHYRTAVYMLATAPAIISTTAARLSPLPGAAHPVATSAAEASNPSPPTQSRILSNHSLSPLLFTPFAIAPINLSTDNHIVSGSHRVLPSPTSRFCRTTAHCSNTADLSGNTFIREHRNCDDFSVSPSSVVSAFSLRNASLPVVFHAMLSAVLIALHTFLLQPRTFFSCHTWNSSPLLTNVFFDGRCRRDD